jgi:hypothetical protein
MSRTTSIAGVALGLMLGACNALVTKTPLLSKADAVGAAPMRDGLWRMEAEADCQVDVTKPLSDWPSCAGGFVVSGDAVVYYNRDVNPAVWSVQPLVVAAGSPRILQAQADVSGDVKLNFRPYVYAGMRPTRTDPQGRIVAVALWPVQCGPPPKNDSAGGTAKPLSGLEMKPGDPICTTTSVVALRAAAKASEAWVPKPLTAQWLREADPQAPRM